MTARVVTTLTEMKSLRGEWDTLARATATPLLDHDWCLSCAEALHDERDLRVVTVREQGRLTAVAPLVLEPGGFGRHLTLLGTQRLFEPGGWLYSSPTAAAELISAVLELRRPMLLPRIPAASDLTGLLGALPRLRGLAVVRRSSPSYVVPTRGSPQELESRLSRRTRTALEKGLASAERVLGPCLIEERVPAPADVEREIEAFADVERSGWKGRQGSSLAQRADLAAFFRTYCSRAAERGRLRVTRLSFGSTLAASEIAVDAYGRRWGLKVAYRDDLAAHLPGIHIAYASLRAAAARGLDAYEFLGSAEDWQRRWRPDEQEYRLVAIYPWSSSGLAGACRHLGGAVIRRMKRKVEH